MSTEAPIQPVQEPGPRPKQGIRPPRRKPAKPDTDGLANPEAGPSVKQGNSSRPPKSKKSRQPGDARHGGPSDTRVEGSSTVDQLPSGSQKARRPPNRQKSRNPGGRPSAPQSEVEIASTGGDISSTSAPAKKPRRAAKFNANLTEHDPKPKEKQEKPAKRYRITAPKGDDLTSRLIYELSTPPWPDCLICFSAINPAQPTWSCSPLIPISSATDDEKDKHDVGTTTHSVETAQCCWTTFHLKCIRPWASKNVKDLEDAWRARNLDRKGEWRCPACQAKRAVVPTSYWCFCGSTPDPKPPRLETPHSCGGPCTRTRACGHPCSLTCHPGPCPPCQITIQLPCYCGHQSMSFRCSHLAPSKAKQAPLMSLSCGRVCDKKLDCGNHRCQSICHGGPCLPCPITHVGKCYCGKVEKELRCGEGLLQESFVQDDQGERKWVGEFVCDNICERPFDCGVHKCQQACHPQDPSPSICPRSPSQISHCPCGKHVLSPSESDFFPPGTKLRRTTCVDRIPTCESTCMKPLEGCDHVCSSRCHAGPCPPCSVSLVRPCRCGSTTRDVKCSEEQLRIQARERGEHVDDILCDKTCSSLRNCGRHQCRRICCPLASFANAKVKGKKKATSVMDHSPADEEGWHQCDIVCEKVLSCGNHKCEGRDHRGVCPPCLRSSFEEMFCHCTRTVLEPPVPCGTRISCSYPCDRPNPPCGHPKAPHSCHEDPTPCPSCVFLTSKRCACGKKMVDNVKCSQEKVSCGQTCGKLLACGFHHCERTCHNGDCGSCSAVCGKPRKLCLPAHHLCTMPCHAPAACSEVEPCHAMVYITCPCGRIRHPVPCGRCISNTVGREGSQQLQCSNECQIAKRNARLAEALGINADNRSDGRQQITYNDELVAFARANPKFCIMVEKSFSDFVSSAKKSQILPHMPESRRKFVHDLATVYRMDTQMVDQEPYRSVQLIRRIDSRVPSPLLSTTASSASTSTTSSGLGRLTDLRSPAPSQSIKPTTSGASAWTRSTPSGGTPGSSAQTKTRGWTSVVNQRSTPKPDANPTAWLTDRNAGPASKQSASASTSRAGSSTSLVLPSTSQVPEDVPDDWEDDT